MEADFLTLGPAEPHRGTAEIAANKRRQSDGGVVQTGSSLLHPGYSAKKPRTQEPPSSTVESNAAIDSTVPWRRVRSSAYKSLPNKSPLLRLHEEILDFAEFVAPTPAEQEIADSALLKLKHIVEATFPCCSMEVFGSRANGLVLPTSDWDVILFGVNPTVSNMRRLASAIAAEDVTSKLEVIDSARIPIVKLREAASGIAIDISFQAESGLVTRAAINDFIRRYPPVRPLILVLKYFLIQRGLNETYTGGVGSYMLTLMAVHVVQAKLAEYRSKINPVGKGQSAGASADDVRIVNEMNLGMLLVSFLELFGLNLNYTTTGISVRGQYGCYFSKRKRSWFDPERPCLLSIENPCDPTVDVGKNSFTIQRVRRAFAYAHTSLARTIRQYGDRLRSREGSGSDVTHSPSLLTAVIRVDLLLKLRAEELLATDTGTGDEDLPGAGPSSLQQQANAQVENNEAATDITPMVTVANHETNAATFDENLHQSLDSANLKIKHKRLFADIFTRKERNVQELMQAGLEGWY